MPFREPPDLDRVDTAFVSGAGTPASELLRQDTESARKPRPVPAPEAASAPEATAEKPKKSRRPAGASAARRRGAGGGGPGGGGSGGEGSPSAVAEAPAKRAGRARSSNAAGALDSAPSSGSSTSRRRSRAKAEPSPATGSGTDAGTDSRYVEPDARMLVNVRMPVALHERLKAASEHTSLTITDIVIRGTETELEAVETRYREITGESIPIQRRKVRID